MNECVARGVASADRVIATIGKHVITQHALAGGDEGVSIDETANLWIIITALQIIEPGILGRGLAKTPFYPLWE
jgi:hypothetical protein